MNYKTEQEKFWAGNFGNEYIKRNNGEQLLASNLNLFTKALKSINKIKSAIEFGSNIGMNLHALKLLYPFTRFDAIEINENACLELSKVIPKDQIFNISILDFKPAMQYELVLIKGVLIHQNPNELNEIYEKLVNSTSKYILICEYYNPTPVEIEYRGHAGKLFKRDFAGDLLRKFNNIRLLDYGFGYHLDTNFPTDDTTWFLLEKF